MPLYLTPCFILSVGVCTHARRLKEDIVLPEARVRDGVSYPVLLGTELGSSIQEHEGLLTTSLALLYIYF